MCFCNYGVPRAKTSPTHSLSAQQTHTNTSSDGNSNGSSDAAAMSTGEFSRATEDAYKKLTEALSHVISSLSTGEALAVDGAAGSVSDAVNEVSSYFASPHSMLASFTSWSSVSVSINTLVAIAGY